MPFGYDDLLDKFLGEVAVALLAILTEAFLLKHIH